MIPGGALTLASVLLSLAPALATLPAVGQQITIPPPPPPPGASELLPSDDPEDQLPAHIVGGRKFLIPFEIPEPYPAEVAYLILFVSTDGGKTWSPAGLASPEQQRFAYHAPTEGTYLFCTRAFTFASDRSLNGNRYWPDLKVIVQKPPRRR